MILQITVGGHAIIVGKKVIQQSTVLQLGGKNLVLFAGVLNIMQSSVPRCVLKRVAQAQQTFTVSITSMISIILTLIFL